MVGVACTAAYAVLFLLLRTVAGAQPANLLALLLTAIGNTAANRRLTFGVARTAGTGCGTSSRGCRCSAPAWR